MLAILGLSFPCVFGTVGLGKRANQAVGTELVIAQLGAITPSMATQPIAS